MTDDWVGYKGLSRDGWQHETVNHSRYGVERRICETRAGLLK